MVFLRPALAGTIVLAALGVVQAAAQVPTAWDVRLATVQSLKPGRVVRVVGPDQSRRVGPVIGSSGSVLVLGAGASSDSVPIAAIDSLWVRKSHSRTGLIVGMLIGTVVAVAASRRQECPSFDQLGSCYSAQLLKVTGIMVAGALLGAGIGSAIPNWQRRYP